MIFENTAVPNMDFKKLQLNIYRYYAINYPFYEMNFHSHAEWEIMYVVQGKCQVTYLEHDVEKCCELREGEYILLQGWIPHILSVKKECPCRILNLEGLMEPTANVGCMYTLGKETSFTAFVSDIRRILIGNDDGRSCG